VRKRRVESARRDVCGTGWVGDRRGRDGNAGYYWHRHHIVSGGRQSVVIHVGEKPFAFGLDVDTLKDRHLGRQPAIRHRTESLVLRRSAMLAAAAQRREAIRERQDRCEALLAARSEAAGGAVRGRAGRPARTKFGEAQSAACERICEAIALPSLLCEPKEREERKGGKDGKPSGKLQPDRDG